MAMSKKRGRRGCGADGGGWFLPEHLTTEILSILPVKSLTRFKSACKLWCQLIESPYCIKLHFNKSNAQSSKNFILKFFDPDKKEPPQISIFSSSDPLGDFRNVEYLSPIFQNKEVDKIMIYGPCNGIFCLYLHHDCYGCHPRDIPNHPGGSFVIWNPATRQTRLLLSPNFSVKQGPSSCYHSYQGFGFDRKVEDYKVVMIYSEMQVAARSLVKLYSLSTDSWREIKSSVPELIAYHYHRGANHSCELNGVFYWLSKDKATIISFDFQREVFGTISIPNSAPCRFHPFNPIKVFESSLAVVDCCFSDSGTDIWLFDHENGKINSFTKYKTLGPCPKFCSFVGFWVNGTDALLDQCSLEDMSHQLILFDTVNKIITKRLGMAAPKPQLVAYTESLVSVKRKEDGQ